MSVVEEYNDLAGIVATALCGIEVFEEVHNGLAIRSVDESPYCCTEKCVDVRREEKVSRTESCSFKLSAAVSSVRA